MLTRFGGSRDAGAAPTVVAGFSSSPGDGNCVQTSGTSGVLAESASAYNTANAAWLGMTNSSIVVGILAPTGDVMVMGLPCLPGCHYGSTLIFPVQAGHGRSGVLSDVGFATGGSGVTCTLRSHIGAQA